MKTFKNWEDQKLTEGAFKEGSVIEGIFAIAVALYLRDAEMPSVRELDKYRRKIIPKNMTERPWSYKFPSVTDQKAGKHPKTKKRYPADTFTVELAVQLKEGEMIKGNVSAFGDNRDGDPGHKYYAKAGDIPKLSEKMGTLLSGLRGTSAIKKIDKFVDKLLSNHTKDKVHLMVDAAGVAGESSGGTIKGDVNIIITAYIGGKKTGETTKIDNLAFSLKSDSSTLANPGAWKAISNLAKAFKIKFNPKTELNDDVLMILSQNATTKDMMVQKQEKTAEIFDVFIDKMKESPPMKVKEIAFHLIKAGAFGEDAADIIEFKSKEIKELVPSMIEQLQHHPAYKNYKYEFAYNYARDAEGNLKKGKDTGRIAVMVTYPDGDGGTETSLFWKFRAKLLQWESGSGKKKKDKLELKLMFEAGSFLFRKTHAPDPNYDMNNFESDWTGSLDAVYKKLIKLYPPDKKKK